VDFVLLVAAAVIADLWSRHSPTFSERVLWPALFVAIALCTSSARGAYRRRLKLDSLDDLVSIGWVLALATAVVVTARVLVDAGPETAATETVRLGLIAAA